MRNLRVRHDVARRGVTPIVTKALGAAAAVRIYTRTNVGLSLWFCLEHICEHFARVAFVLTGLGVS